jgi:UDP-glucose 6-dehydrogenase
MIMVATPSTGGDRHYDHTAVNKVLRQMAKSNIANKHIVIGCTVMPGYIQNVARYIFKDCENVTVRLICRNSSMPSVYFCLLAVSRLESILHILHLSLFLSAPSLPSSLPSYSPEFIAQGDIIRGLKNPDLILIGAGSPAIGNLLEEMYARIAGQAREGFRPAVVAAKVPKICRMSAESAEIAKLSINCFVTTKISFANMIGDIADRSVGADKHDILDCVGADSRYHPQLIITPFNSCITGPPIHCSAEAIAHFFFGV